KGRAPDATDGYGPVPASTDLAAPADRPRRPRGPGGAGPGASRSGPRKPTAGRGRSGGSPVVLHTPPYSPYSPRNCDLEKWVVGRRNSPALPCSLSLLDAPHENPPPKTTVHGRRHLVYLDRCLGGESQTGASRSGRRAPDGRRRRAGGAPILLI